MSSRLKDSVTTLAWSGWGALGAGTWGSAHRSWSVDPEALLLLTGALSDRDPRLHEESLRWVSRHGHLVSRTRIGRLLDTWPHTSAWTEYAEELGIVTGRRWPGAGKQVTARVVPKGGDHPMGEQLVLRLRSGIGVSVKSEIIRIMLAAPMRLPATAADLAGEAGYSKRSVASAAGQMASAGLLVGVTKGSAIAYRLRDPVAWTTLFGPVPTVSLSFLSLCRAASVMLIGLNMEMSYDELADGGEIVRSVAARNVLRDASSDLANLGIDTPRLVPGADVFDLVEEFATNEFALLASGET